MANHSITHLVRTNGSNWRQLGKIVTGSVWPALAKDPRLVRENNQAGLYRSLSQHHAQQRRGSGDTALRNEK
jgi:hypothetical protein